MQGSTLGKRIVGSAVFGRLMKQAARYSRNPHELQALLARARTKAETAGSSGALRELWNSLMLLLRFVRAYARGDYRQVPVQTLLLVVAAVLYFVMPIDVIPDFIMGVGFLDDAAVIAWVVKTVAGELDAFGRWEASNVRSEASGR